LTDQSSDRPVPDCEVTFPTLKRGTKKVFTTATEIPFYNVQYGIIILELKNFPRNPVIYPEGIGLDTEAVSETGYLLGYPNGSDEISFDAHCQVCMSMLQIIILNTVMRIKHLGSFGKDTKAYFKR